MKKQTTKAAGKGAAAEHPVAPLGCWQCLRARKARPYNGREKTLERAFADQGKDYSRKA